ncbi:hypothetical protein BJ508DRAFT_358489 [Ascobolus immersus RN42]|uniref:Uncharacterized protein n=1 Tax=Ascobolus immersus RN42 TaxID=1160509 RepID=A0A3N4IWC2_ASCIM|nr:hypothetical protein BJ508DRAFT_358489 [Ascobolus immersus RN42]
MPRWFQWGNCLPVEPSVARSVNQVIKRLAMEIPIITMQFTTILAAALSLITLTSALPQSTATGTACYDNCLSQRICIMSYPAGCYCMNDARAACATECKVGKPFLDSCDLINPIEPEVPIKPAPVKPKVCFDKCVSEWACIQSWPESCYCANGIKKRCADQCNYSGAKYQQCPATTAANVISV